LHPVRRHAGGTRRAMDACRARGGAAAHRAHAHPLPQLPGKPLPCAQRCIPPPSARARAHARRARSVRQHAAAVRPSVRLGERTGRGAAAGGERAPRPRVGHVRRRSSFVRRSAAAPAMPRLHAHRCGRFNACPPVTIGALQPSSAAVAFYNPRPPRRCDAAAAPAAMPRELDLHTWLQRPHVRAPAPAWIACLASPPADSIASLPPSLALSVALSVLASLPPAASDCV
jgi:hypothetical protein